MTNKENALQSIINETKTLIHRREGKYAWSVINDFEDALRAGDDRHRVAYRWLQEYKTGKRAKQVEEKPKEEAAKPFPKKARKEWTDYKPTGNKFAEMWRLTNKLQSRYADIPKKVKVMKEMAKLADAETKEHFRMALAEVLRSDKESDVRFHAIWLLAEHFEWREIEWTFWLHERRGQELYTLIAAEAWCKLPNKTPETQKKAIRATTERFLAEAIR